MSAQQKLIVVIGAGVTGLQTSISLLEAGYRVFIIGKDFPGDESIEYTSPWAGAHWRSHATKADLEEQQWDTETYKHWLGVIEKERDQRDQTALSGLGLCKSRIYSALPETPWYSSSVLSFETIPEDSLEPGIQHGHTFTSIVINVPKYLKYLQKTAESLGAISIPATLPRDSSISEMLHSAAALVKSHFNELAQTSPPPISAFVNATGISSLHLVPDPTVYPIRGQTIIVAGEAHQITTIGAPSSPTTSSSPLVTTPIMYILPRPHSNTTILGGTKDVDSWDDKPDVRTTVEILRRAKAWAPELLDQNGCFNVLNQQVGFRPGRKGGPRVEVEEVGDLLVCHAYGHAGAGYQNSVGSARKVVGLLGEWLGKVDI